MTDSGTPPSPAGQGETIPPRRPAAFTVPPVTLAAAAVLVAVFGVLTLMPVSWTASVVEAFSVRPLRVAFALHDPVHGRPVLAAASLLTHALIHIDGMHIGLNVAFLLAFGTLCERAFGPRRLVVILIVSAIAGAFAKLAVDWQMPVIMFGASGAVFGCMGAIIRPLIGGSVRPARRGMAWVKWMVVACVAIALIGPALFDMGARVAWDAHMGGFFAGVLLGWPPRPVPAPSEA